MEKTGCGVSAGYGTELMDHATRFARARLGRRGVPAADVEDFAMLLAGTAAEAEMSRFDPSRPDAARGKYRTGIFLNVFRERGRDLRHAAKCRAAAPEHYRRRSGARLAADVQEVVRLMADAGAPTVAKAVERFWHGDSVREVCAEFGVCESFWYRLLPAVAHFFRWAWSRHVTFPQNLRRLEALFDKE